MAFHWYEYAYEFLGYKLGKLDDLNIFICTVFLLYELACVFSFYDFREISCCIFHKSVVINSLSYSSRLKFHYLPLLQAYQLFSPLPVYYLFLLYFLLASACLNLY